MSWVRDSDDVARDEALREAGAHPALLWFVAMRECAAKEGDGVMSPLMIEDAANLYRLKATACTKALTEQGVWHDQAGLDACGQCLEHTPSLPSARHRVIHGWWEHLLRADGKEDPIKRKRERRRKALNSAACLSIRQAVRERDKDLCRYCANAVIFGTSDRRSKTMGTYDHKDPWGDNAVDNLVVACKRCNGRKNERTPEEAGMVLLAPGTTRSDLARPGQQPDPTWPDPTETDPEPGANLADPADNDEGPGANPDSDLAESAADLARARVTRKTGAGQVGPGRTWPKSGYGPDPERHGAGTGPGPWPLQVSAETDSRHEEIA